MYGVTDGDTIVLLDSTKVQHKIRLTGIDAPERGQAFGTKSKEHLSDLVAGKSVVVDYSKYDRYQRILGKVLLNGEDVNLEQVEAGLAPLQITSELDTDPSCDLRFSYVEPRNTDCVSRNTEKMQVLLMCMGTAIPLTHRMLIS